MQLSQTLLTALFVAALPLSVVAACAEADPQPHGTADAPGRGVNVPLSWQEARRVDGHHEHVVIEKIACVKCHELTETTIKGLRKDACIGCHEKEAKSVHAQKHATKRWGPNAKSDCLDCHAYTLGDDYDGGLDAGPDAALDPHPASDCGRCHEKDQGDIPAVRVHGTRDCLKCHQPHGNEKPKSAPCSECHGDVETTHAAQHRSLVDVCTTCHKSQHGLMAEAKAACADCHAKEKPIVPATALFEDGHTDCVGCHQPHQFGKAEAIECRSCHEDTHTLGAPRVRAHNQCNSCHNAHDVKNSPDRACANCHKDKHPDHPKKGAAGTCVGCHEPHPPASRRHTRARNCSSCHQEARSDQEFHGKTACRKCHTPHQFKRTLADLTACNGCHASQVTLTRTLPKHSRCQDCHQGLPHRPSALTASCAKCHDKTASQVVKGHTKCASCHEPHGGKVQTACRSCHQQEHKTAPAGHQNCTSCHQPHTGSTASKPCASCHKSEAKSAHGLLKQGCASCHSAHGPKGVQTPPACDSCHKKTDLPGLHAIAKHKQCSQCHAGHGPAPGATKAVCLSCHTAQKNHEPGASSCANCHLFTKSR